MTLLVHATINDTSWISPNQGSVRGNNIIPYVEKVVGVVSMGRERVVVSI